MSEELDRLWRLHDLDERAAAAKSAVAKFPGLKQSLDGRVTAEQQRLAAHVKAAEDLLKARRKLEQEVEAAATQQRQFESRQPSVKTNAEFQALSHEINGCKQKRSDLETEVLKRLEEEDALAQQKPAIERALKAAEAERAERMAGIDREEAEAKAVLAGIEAERDAELGALAPMTRQRYERIHASRDGRAVVPIVKNACGGCFRSQPPQMLQESRRAERLLVCDGCGRILIQPPGEA